MGLYIKFSHLKKLNRKMILCFLIYQFNNTVVNFVVAICCVEDKMQTEVLFHGYYLITSPSIIIVVTEK